MTEDNIKKSLRYSIYDGAAFAVMDGFTASFLTPFAVALNASVNLIAALTYVPQLVGAFIQLFATKLVEILKDRRKILVASSFFHAILWIPLLLIPYVTPSQKYLLIVYVTLQTIFAQLINPVWNSLMGDLVPKYERGRFFGLRNRIVGATSFVAALIAGFILNHFSPKHPFLGFTILFSVAFFARLVSGIFKGMMHNLPPDLEHAEKFSLIDFVKRMDKTNYGHFVIYITLFKFAVNIAAPFFAVYMLKDLGLSYLQFTFILAAEMIASFLALGIWGNLIDTRGTKLVLYVTGMLTPIVPLLWLFSSNLYYLIAIEIFSGIAWAGFNLSSSNFIFDSVKPENRVRCIAYYKFFEGIATFAGALLGGFLIGKLPAWIFISSIPIVFLISGILRLIASLTLLPTLKEARLIELDVGHSFFKKYLTIRPSEGLVYEVIGKYRKAKEKIKQTLTKIKPKKQKTIDKKEAEAYKKRLLKYIDKNISPKKEKHELTNMHEIEHIAEEIEKGKVRK
ncbi:MFS transporter [Candidatus Woesearchaeota archaeon]|nr:MFS transporter [Candidatus Woesearchaeota archaeon]